MNNSAYSFLKIIIITIYYCNVNYLLASTMYVKSIKLSPFLNPKHGSKKIETLKRGDSVEQLKKIGFWLEIKTRSGKIGWVPKLTLSNLPPKMSSSILNKNNINLSKSARKRASNFTSAGAARGLKDNQADFDKVNFKADFQALKLMESFYIIPFKAINFIKIQ